MIINDERLKKSYFLLLRNYVAKDLIIYDQSLIAVSEDETNIVICLKLKEVLNQYNILIVKIVEDDVDFVNMITTRKGDSIKGIDISNTCDVALLWSEGSKERITIFDFSASGDETKDYSFTEQEIQFYNACSLLFNNKNSSLSVAMNDGRNPRRFWSFARAKDMDGYVSMARISFNFSKDVGSINDSCTDIEFLQQANKIMDGKYIVKFTLDVPKIIVDNTQEEFSNDIELNYNCKPQC